MARGGSCTTSMFLLAFLLALSWGRSTMAQEVQSTNDTSDFPTSYRYLMNGTTLGTFETGSIILAPLSASLWGLSPLDVSNNVIAGNLRDVNASTATALSAVTISYISCDEPDATKAITDSFNATNVGNVLAAVLYSETQSHCSISRTLAEAGWLKLLTVTNMDRARQIAELGNQSKNLGMVQIGPDLNSLPPGTHLNPARQGSPIPMIILYALTSLITVLLLIVIIGGAIKARRHPERYGPRNIMGRPRQSRAKGIAMAMLATLPIVKFGDPDPKNTKSVGQDRDVEMIPAQKQVTGEDETSKVERVSNEADENATPLAVDTSLSATDLTITEPNPSAGGAPEDGLPKSANESLGCSICTEDFTLGEELRVLPCDHKFHPVCVDPWLLNISGTCPLCRIDLRPPQELTDENAGPSIRRAASDRLRRRSTIGAIMRGRVLDRQAVADASREERIRILRRWREERQQQQQQRQAESGLDTNADTDTEVQRTSRRFSQWLRDGLSVRPAQDPPSPPSQGDQSPLPGRPHSWYAREPTAAANPAPPPPPLPLSSHDAIHGTERARSWCATAAAPASSNPLNSGGQGPEVRDDGR